MPNIQKMMKQVQRVQAEMARIQEELGGRRVEGTAGGGAVRVVANGHQELVEVLLDPEAVDPEDVEMLQDLILTAANDALKRSQELAAQEMAKVTGGLNVPGLPGLP
ncbi:YbaB/EbfC family nucleoid-associated protein [Limnochorda pilosa]|uniref:Nucleoid-associated protein LIP_3201 n=1 Tax=Limnochorda pilosa TaxID=1555112 RepID=A0A0K2SPG9_LIMPI|nr:nucleoid-associated protein [Limnochorda pilosa]